MENNRYALIRATDVAIDVLLKADGDRDQTSHSDISCEESMAIVELLRTLKSKIWSQEDIDQDLIERVRDDYDWHAKGRNKCGNDISGL
jgi:hypothetical protein